MVLVGPGVGADLCSPRIEGIEGGMMVWEFHDVILMVLTLPQLMHNSPCRIFPTLP